MAATYKDIQKATGLSLSTISKYFNGGVIREENRAAIDAAVRQLDYRVNVYARSLKSRRSCLAGVLVPETESFTNARIVAELQTLLKERGYGMLLCSCSLDKEKEKDAVASLLAHMVDGILTVPFDKSGRQFVTALERNVPVVILDRLTTEVETDAVTMDNERAGEMAVEALVERGHTRIALLNGPASLYTMRERQSGFERVLIRHGIPLRPEWILEGAISLESGYENAKRLMEQDFRPKAVFCTNYESTLGAMLAFNETELRVPDDVSLVGFDVPPLTGLAAVAQPIGPMAQEAVDLLLGRIEGDLIGRSRIRRLAPEFSIGESVSRIKVY